MDNSAWNRVRWKTVFEGMTHLVTLLTGLGILWSVYQYSHEADNRRRAAVFSAWSVVSLSSSSAADGGRGEALKQLVELHQRLSGLHLNQAILYGVHLDSILLEQLHLEDATLADCSFKNSQIARGWMARAVFRSTCDFSRAQFSDVDMRGTRFTDAALNNASFERVNADTSTSFNGAAIRSAVFSDSILNDVIFDSATMDNVIFANGSQLGGARFVRATMPGCQVYRTSAVGAQFQLAEMAHCRIALSSDLSYANFDQADLRSATFRNVDLRGASFFGSHLEGAMFIGCDLTGVDFGTAATKGAVFLGNRASRVGKASL